jgi:hypothetical protein
MPNQINRMHSLDILISASNSSQSLLQSPIFHPVTGFGGDGVPGTYALPPDPNGEAELGPFTPAELINIWRGCVRNGPFANSVFHLGPGKMKTPHCLVRGINEPLLQEWLSTARVQEALATQSYEEFRLLIDIDFYGIHGGGHGILGGEMTNGFSAPGGSSGIFRERFLVADPPFGRPTLLPAPCKSRQSMVALAGSRPCEPTIRHLWPDRQIRNKPGPTSQS